MKHYFKPYKLVKSFVLTGVLSVGLITGGHFTAAAGLDQAKVEPAQATQAKSSLHVHAEEKETSKVPPKQVDNSQPTDSAKPAVPAQPANPAHPAVPAQPKEIKAEIQHKEIGSLGKSQASIQSSETAKMNASENSAIFYETPVTESNETSETSADFSDSSVTELTETEATEEYFFGSDSATSANPEGEDFYIGKLGYGNTVQFDASTGGGKFFSSDRAQDATYIYGYWFLSSMQTAPTGMSATDWGVHQAKLALQVYETMKSVYGSKVRPVIFIDVEPALTGMKDYDYENNRLIYNAFVDYLNQFGEGVKPGTYSSPGSWERTMGDFSPRTPGAYWVAYYPSEIPTNLTTSNSDWLNFPGTDEKAEIWQYYGGDVDYNVAWKLP